MHAIFFEHEAVLFPEFGLLAPNRFFVPSVLSRRKIKATSRDTPGRSIESGGNYGRGRSVEILHRKIKVNGTRKIGKFTSQNQSK